MTTAFVYVTDERGFELAAQSAISLIISQPGPADIHFFCYKFVPAVPDSLTHWVDSRHACLTIQDIHDPEAENHLTSGHVTTPSLLKLLAIERLIEKYDRVVYLDSDILVFEPLKLDVMDFQQFPVAAVIDMDLSRTGALRHSAWSTALGKAEIGNYFNSGFMIFLRENWKKHVFYNRYLAALDEHDVQCRYKLNCTSIDQCALNTTFENQWRHLPIGYNMQAGAKFTALWKTSAVRHYCGVRKFTPLMPFRSDGKEVSYFGRVVGSGPFRRAYRSLAFESLFRLNAARNRRAAAAMNRFLDAAQLGHAAQ